MKRTSCISALVLAIALLVNQFSASLVFAETSSANNVINIASDSFDDYTVGQSLLEPGLPVNTPGANGWGQSAAFRTGTNDSAVIAVDPDNPSNKVLKITASPGRAPKYRLFFNDVPNVDASDENNYKFRVSYKLRLDKNSTDMWAWLDSLGMLTISNDSGAMSDSYKGLLFNGGQTKMLTYRYEKKDEAGYFYEGTYNLDNWVKVDQVIDINTNEIKTVISDLDPLNPSVKIYGLDGTHFAGNPSIHYTTVKSLDFGLSPNDNAGSDGILYVDDIKVQRIKDSAFDVSLETQTIAPNESLQLNFTNPILKETLAGAITVKLEDNTFRNPASVKVSEDNKTAYINFSNLELNKNYTIVIDKTKLVDYNIQTLSGNAQLAFSTSPYTGRKLVIKNVTFDESGYELGKSVLGVDGWSVFKHNKAAEDSITVDVDPNDGTNKVLKIVTTAGSNPCYILPLNDIPNSGILKVTYKIKMPLLPQGSTENYKWAWTSNLGTLLAKNLGNGNTNDMFAQIMFNGGDEPIISYRAITKADESSPPTYGGYRALTSIKDGWTIVEKYIDIDNDGKMKIISSKYFDDGKIAQIETAGMTEGYGSTQYANESKYDVVTGILFGIDPQSAENAVSSATLYVDDITVERVPKYYVENISAAYAAGSIFATFKVGNFNNCESANKEGVSLIFAAYNKTNGKLEEIATKNLKHEYTYILRGKDGNGNIWVDSANPRTVNIIDEYAEVSLSKIPSADIVDLYVFLWDGVSMKPLIKKQSVTLQ